MTDILPFDHVSQSYHRHILDEVRSIYGDDPPDAAQLLSHTDRQLARFVSRVRRQSDDWRHYFGNISEPGSELRVRWPTLTALGRKAIEFNRQKRAGSSRNFFTTYAERTSGSTGKPFAIYRTSHSVQREMLRLRYVLANYAKHFRTAHPDRVLYLSRSCPTVWCSFGSVAASISG